jgi:hypothetical protein
MPELPVVTYTWLSSEEGLSAALWPAIRVLPSAWFQWWYARPASVHPRWYPDLRSGKWLCLRKSALSVSTWDAATTVRRSCAWHQNMALYARYHRWAIRPLLVSEQTYISKKQKRVPSLCEVTSCVGTQRSVRLAQSTLQMRPPPARERGRKKKPILVNCCFMSYLGVCVCSTISVVMMTDCYTRKMETAQLVS